MLLRVDIGIWGQKQCLCGTAASTKTSHLSLVFTVNADFCGFIDLATIHTETLLRKRRCFVSVFFSSMRWLLRTKEILSKSLWETWWRTAPLLTIVPRRNCGLRAFYCAFGRLVHADLLKKKTNSNGLWNIIINFFTHSCYMLCGHTTNTKLNTETPCINKLNLICRFLSPVTV